MGNREMRCGDTGGRRCWSRSETQRARWSLHEGWPWANVTSTERVGEETRNLPGQGRG